MHRGTVLPPGSDSITVLSLCYAPASSNVKGMAVPKIDHHKHLEMCAPSQHRENQGKVSNSCLLRRMIPLVCRLQCFYPSHHHHHQTVRVLEPPTAKYKDDAIQSEEPNRPHDRTRGGWKSMPCIIANESCEKVASLGLIANMIVYLTTRFNMENVAASNVLNIWSGTTSLAPLMGAFISDSYIGRFWTIALASIVSLMGMVVLWLTAQLPQLRPPHCSSAEAAAAEGIRVSCVSASKSQLGVLFSGFALLTVGAAGIRPCSMAFGADQFDHNSSKGRRNIQSFFNWYYFSIAVSFTLALTVIVYVQDNISWSWGLGIPTAMMFFSVTSFFLGAPLYIHVQPQGSAYTGFVQVIAASFKKRHLPLPSDSTDLHADPGKSVPVSTDQFRFLNRAAIKTDKDFHDDGSVISPWTISTLQKVEELKSMIRIMPVWSTGIVIFMAFAQLGTFSVVQALAMDRHIGPHFRIPAGSFGVFGLLSLSLWLPIYDRIVVPVSRRYRKGGITVLQRMGIGLAISILSMVVAGLVEIKRRNTAQRHGLVDKPIILSALWLIPQYCLSGLAEAFNGIGQIEFYYDQFPESMRSIGVALFSCNMAIGNYLSSFLVTVVHRTTGGHQGHENWLAQNLNRGRLEYFYWNLALISFFDLLYFIVIARWYPYKSTDVALDENTVDQDSVSAVTPSSKHHTPSRV